jgi:hypothetical protein
MSTSLMELDEVCPIPLLILALIEARKFRWDKTISSKEDSGEEAIYEWFRTQWRTWYRKNWVEHLNGKKFIEGFSSDEFNIVSNEKDDTELVETIVGFLTEDGNKSENLGIILWASELGTDIDKILKFLRKIKINSKRFTWDKESIQFICLALREADKYKWIESQKACKDIGEKAVWEWFKNFWGKWKQENLKTE